jgi:energy-coupling factor transporter ATP-binding protein EcfA2
LIQFRDLSFGWSGDKLIFDQLELNLPLDKIILLTGENAIGKSTLASLAAGLIKPLTGEVLLNNQPFSEKHKAKDYQSISYLQQAAGNNLMGIDAEADLKLWLLSLPKLTETKALLERALDYWELSEIKNRPVWELSAGEQQRLCLAGLSMFPNRYWIMDEPDAALDKHYLHKLIETLLCKREQGTGALIISHNHALFEGITDEHWHLGKNSINKCGKGDLG